MVDSSCSLSYSYDGAGASPPPTPPTSVAISIAIGAMTSSSSPHLRITTTNPASSNHHQSSSAPRSNSSPRGGTGGTGGGGGGTNQACAACKYQRRKCNPDCPLAPYFPADQQRRFLNAHRIFGVSNILKTLRRLKPELCDDAMRTLIYHAEMRAIDPVGGCLRIILELEQQLKFDTAELSEVLHHLALCRQAATAGVMGGPCSDLVGTSSVQQPLLLSTEQEDVDAIYANQEADNHDQAHSPQDHGEQQQFYDYFYYDTVETTADDDASSKPSLDINVDVMHLQHFDYDTSCATDHKVETAPPPVSRSLEQQFEDHCQIDQKEYEIKAASLVDVFDMQQELQAVDMKADIDINVVIVDANTDIDVKEEEDAKSNIAVGEAAQMAESSHCRLGLGFSSF